MKKLALSVGALCAAMLFIVYCTDVKFNNPLDEKGDNFLFNVCENANTEAERENCIKEMTRDVDGTSGLFDTTRNREWRCDNSVPQLTLVGPPSVNITTNELSEFRKWMGIGGNWSEVLSWTGADVSILLARLVRGGGDENVSFTGNTVPPEGTYSIVYAAERPKCPDKDTPPRAEVRRGLIISETVVVDTLPPTVRLEGLTIVTVETGQTYDEPGATAVNAGNQDVVPITRIELRSRLGAGYQVVGQWTSIGAVNIPPHLLQTAPDTLTMIYYATSTASGKEGSAIRTIYVTTQGGQRPPPTIILNNYRHNIQGNTIQYPDTALTINGQYVEKGVRRVYYVRDGNEVDIPTNLIVTTGASQTVFSPTRQTITYTIPIDPNGVYGSASATRYIYRYDPACDDEPQSRPTVTLQGGNPLNLRMSDSPWNFNTGTSGWTVRDNDPLPTTGGWTGKYLIDLGTLDPDNDFVARGAVANPQIPLKIGAHKITYVGIGACGVMDVQERTVSVAQ